MFHKICRVRKSSIGKDYEYLLTHSPKTKTLNYGDPVYEGRVEIYHNGQWGTICNDIYGTAVNGGPQNVNTVATAQVICNQLGYGVVATSFQFPDAECENFPNAYHVGVRNSLRQHKLR